MIRGYWKILLSFLIIIFGLYDYQKFISKRKTVYNSFSVADTPFGQVEYIDLGAKGDPVILFSTGGGAGIDSVLAFDWLINSHYRIIAVNRPGYYDLPITAAESIQEHADIYHEVIESLNIKEVNIFGVSMGGLSALYYAQKFPVRSIVLWSAVTGEYHPNQESVDTGLGKLIMAENGKDIMSWVMLRMTRLFPVAVTVSLLRAEAEMNKTEAKALADYLIKDDTEKKRLDQFITSMTPMSRLFPGMIDELEKSAQSQEFDWDSMTMPILAVHSMIDKDVGYKHFERLKNNVVNGEFLTVKAGGHFVWWSPEGKEVIEKTESFLDKVNKSQ